MIYLACPYAHEDKAVMEKRFDDVTKFAGSLMKLGVLVYSPVTHNHPVAIRVDLPRTWDYWAMFDIAILANCSQLIVLKLDGWQKSTGVAAEIKFCQENNIPITYI